MICVVHVTSSTTDLQTQRCLSRAMECNGGEFTSIRFVIGRGGDAANLPIAAMLLRSGKDAVCTAVHAWGSQALAATLLAGFPKLIYTPQADSTPRHDRLLRSLFRGRQIKRVDSFFDFSRIPAGRNHPLRSELGFTDNDFVILAPCESTRSAGHRQGLWATSILHVTDPRFRFLAWGRGSQSPGLAKFASRLLQPKLLVLAEPKLGREIDMEQLLGVADLALIPGTGPESKLPIAMAMAAGLPIVAATSRSASRWIEHRKTGLLAGKPAPKTLAQEIYELALNPTLAASLGQAARPRIEVADLGQSNLSRWAELYRQMAVVP